METLNVAALAWAGGLMPVGWLSIVRCKFRNGLVRDGPALSFYWPHSVSKRGGYDILFYEIIG